MVSGCKEDVSQSAYKVLVEKYSPGIVKVCIRYMIDKEHAKDVLQDSLIKNYSEY
ncbi:MAG: sigma-70 family RNA polymerase sigma factor [Saprospiraceae bacterium]|nr:sigma-70 family RNA polymerase sigma factor [Saprospiraceae bacterium]